MTKCLVNAIWSASASKLINKASAGMLVASSAELLRHVSEQPLILDFYTMPVSNNKVTMNY
jgi:hypothetical protein